MPALYGTIRFHFSRNELGPALALAERAVAATARTANKMALAVASYASGWVALALGRTRAAEERLGRAVHLLDNERQRTVREVCGIDLRILAEIYLTWCALARGRPGAARRRARDALAEAERIGHPLTLVVALDRAAMVAGLLGEFAELAVLAERLIEVGRAQCFPAYVWKGPGSGPLRSMRADRTDADHPRGPSPQWRCGVRGLSQRAAGGPRPRAIGWRRQRNCWAARSHGSRGRASAASSASCCAPTRLSWRALTVPSRPRSCSRRQSLPRASRRHHSGSCGQPMIWRSFGRLAASTHAQKPFVLHLWTGSPRAKRLAS